MKYNASLVIFYLEKYKKKKIIDNYINNEIKQLKGQWTNKGCDVTTKG